VQLAHEIGQRQLRIDSPGHFRARHRQVALFQLGKQGICRVQAGYPCHSALQASLSGDEQRAWSQRQIL